MYERQALVLVNLGGATGEEVVRLAECVSAAVQEKFGVLLEQEPVLL
jgi:UDP-N-acetylmuramate dehydrogenase